MLTFTFTHHTMSVRLAHRLCAMAQNMYLSPTIKNNFGVITVTVECDTPREKYHLTQAVENYGKPITA